MNPEELTRAIQGIIGTMGAQQPQSAGGSPDELLKRLQALHEPVSDLGSTAGGRHDPYMGSVSQQIGPDGQAQDRRMVIPPSRGRETFAADAVPGLGPGVSVEGLDPNTLRDLILMLQSNPISPTAEAGPDLPRTGKGNLKQNESQRALNTAKRNNAGMSDRNIPNDMEDYDIGDYLLQLAQ